MIGLLTIPDYRLWGRGDIRSYYQVIARAVSELGKDIAQNVPTDTTDGVRLRADFGLFKQRFGADYSEYMVNPVWLPVAPGSTVVETMRGYAGDYNQLEARYTALTGRSATYVPPHVERVPGDASWELPTWGWGMLGVIALGFAAWGANSLARVYERMPGLSESRNMHRITFEAWARAAGIDVKRPPPGARLAWVKGESPYAFVKVHAS